MNSPHAGRGRRTGECRQSWLLDAVWQSDLDVRILEERERLLVRPSTAQRTDWKLFGKEPLRQTFLASPTILWLPSHLQMPAWKYRHGFAIQTFFCSTSFLTDSSELFLFANLEIATCFWSKGQLGLAVSDTYWSINAIACWKSTKSTVSKRPFCFRIGQFRTEPFYKLTNSQSKWRANFRRESFKLKQKSSLSIEFFFGWVNAPSVQLWIRLS